MSKSKINFNVLVKLIDKYRTDAEICLEAGAYFAGLVSVRAALESMLLSRFLLELYEWEPEELNKYEITMQEDLIEVARKDIPNLKTLIQEAFKAKLIGITGYQAAERIRIWGNKIHASRIASKDKLPNINSRNLKARIKDLDLVANQLLRSL